MRITFEKYDKIEKLSKLKASRFQRNKHSKEQIERLAKIMREHGVRHPIHIHKEYGEIAFGHGRKEAAKLNGWKDYPIVYQEFKDDDEYYSVVQSDNAIAAWAELDIVAINLDMEELKERIDTDLLGLKSILPIEISSSGEKLNISEEWKDMPEFSQEDKTAVRSLLINFKYLDDVKEFAKLIKQNITDKTRSVWFPKAEIERLMDKRYSDES